MIVIYYKPNSHIENYSESKERFRNLKRILIVLECHKPGTAMNEKVKLIQAFPGKSTFHYKVLYIKTETVHRKGLGLVCLRII